MSSRFENDVKIYGIQSFGDLTTAMRQFENDVKIYGIQTLDRYPLPLPRLRMM